MRTLLLILLFIAVPLAGGSLKPEMETEFWKDSGVGLDFAKRAINDADCAAEEQNFNACRKAMLVGAQIQGLDRHHDFEKLKSLRFPAAFPFEKTLVQILTGKSGTQVEWLIGKMINAQIKMFDPYANLTPQGYSEYVLNGENKTFYSTGIEGEANGAGLFIYRIFPNSPAASKEADLRVHDRIVSLNGRRLNSLNNAQLAIPLLNGTPGEKLVLRIERDGQPLRTVTLQVAPVDIPENPSAEFLVNGKRFLQVRLRSFSRGACLFLEKRIAGAQAVSEIPLSGLILDLRLNRGGLVEESECLVRLFTAQKAVVTREPLHFGFPRALDFQPDLLPTSSKKVAAAPFAHLPLTVLINAKSASASEIAAGALQDYGRAWIVGERSYGKGTTQVLHVLKEFPKLAVTKTVSRYMRPSGLSVHGSGVMPNFEVPAREEGGPLERSFVREEDVVSVIKLPVGERWQEARIQQVLEKHSCMQRSGIMVRSEKAVSTHLGFSDHQAAFALAVLNCP